MDTFNFDLKKNSEIFNSNNNPVRNINASCDLIHETSKDDTLIFRYTSKPTIWGPKFWYILHNCSINYPKNATNLCAKRTSNFILGIPYFLPCSDCRKHAIDYLSHFDQKDLFMKCKKKENLMKFFVEFHNYVNERTGKPKFTLQDLHNNFMDDDETH